MFINPTIAIEEGWIAGIKDEAKQVQPNAIDFTLDKLMFVSPEPPQALVTEHAKRMRLLIPQDVDAEGLWTLVGQGGVYDGTSDMYVNLPDGVAAMLFTRSTFARNGVLIASGLYDSGYKGHLGFTIYTHGGQIVTAPGTRIGQIAFVRSENAKTYGGGWNHESGTHYTDTLSKK